MSLSFTVSALAKKLDAEWRGDGDKVVTGIKPIDEAGPDDVSFLSNPKFAAKAKDSKAGCILTSDDALAATHNVILTGNPYFAFARVLGWMHPEDKPEPGVSPRALVHGKAKVGEDCTIESFVIVEEGAVLGDGVILMPGVFIGKGSRVGSRTKIEPNAVIMHGVTIGEDCIIHGGAVIGADGFGFVMEDGEHQKIPQVGGVVVGNKTEIGANSTIDRGTMGPTIIGNGVKIDNLVMIAHNCVIGDHSMIISQVGLSGSTVLGQYVLLAGQVGSAGHLKIGDGAIAAARTGIVKDVPAFARISGAPAENHEDWKKEVAALHYLPEALKTIRELKRRVEALEKQPQK